MNEQTRDVNIAAGDNVSELLYSALAATHSNRPGLVVSQHDSFSGYRAMTGKYLNGVDLNKLEFNLGFDGVGTKVEVSERLNDHSVVAHDLFAMVCDDAVVRGAEPVAIGSILDIRHLDESEATRTAMQQLATGYIDAAKAAGVVIVNGETAELGGRIRGYQELDGYSVPFALLRRIGAKALGRTIPEHINYNWGAAVLWFAHTDRALTGHQVKPGDSLIGLEETGFRSNGLTDARKAMRQEYGRRWHEKYVRELGGMSLGELVQQPSTIYTRFVNGLTGGFRIENEPKAKVTGVAHITGGGQPSKLGRMLEPSGLGATIDRPLAPPRIMLHVQKIRGFTDREAYGKFHMGPGMVIATPEPENVLREARAFGLTARRIGEVTDEPGIRIRNLGAQHDEEWLSF
jgi:phosphoribosylformylglycinamidine cyclo-ligase